MKRVRLYAVLVAVALIASTSVVLIYALTTTPDLAVFDGSIMTTIEGNFSAVSSTSPLWKNFSATTYINQSEHPGSTLTISLHTAAYYDSGWSGGGVVVLNVFVRVLGHFASNLHPGQLLLTYNETGTLISGASQTGFRTGTNVSLSDAPLSVVDAGSATLPVPLIDESAAVPFYDFNYSDFIRVEWSYPRNHFVGLNAGVTGLGALARVGVLLEILNQPGGTWT